MNRTTRALVDELVRAYPFPDPREADRRGLLAAYAQGVFPWYDEDPILWYSPDPRTVLLPNELHVGRSLEKKIRATPFVLTMDRAFGEVIRACAAAARPGQGGTWIGTDMIAAYETLHELGFAHSVEAWESAGEEMPGRLVGGLYGVSLGRAFFGESMFASAADASKVAFAAFVGQLERWGFELVDCQVKTAHLERFGAREWRRAEFLRVLAGALEGETRRGRWTFDEG